MDAMSAWFLENCASRNMTEEWEIFNYLTESESYVYVDIVYDAKYVMKGEGIVTFQLESGGSLDA
jgi:hypothetical protein